MAILVNGNSAKRHQKVEIGCKSHEQMRFLRNDPAPHVEFEHVIKARNKREMVRDIIGTILLGIVIFGLPVLGKCVALS